MPQSFTVGATAVLVLAGFISAHLASAEPLSIGSINREAAAEVRKFLPLANYLRGQLKPQGIDEVRVVIAKDISQMATFLREGKVDVYIDSPLTSLAASLLSGSKFVLRRWKKGRAEYRSVIFAGSDNNLQRLKDLKGGILAFEEPFSSAGYLIPKMALVQEGLNLVSRPDATNPRNRQDIGYVFTNDDENSLAWVDRGKALAGATDDHKYERKTRRSPNSFKVIYTSSPFPRQVVSCRADLPPKLVTKIKKILIGMDQSQEGRSALKDFEETTKFDELAGSSMAQLLSTQRFVAAEIGLR